MRDERRLARRAARGDRDAFTAIFRRFQQDLYRYCVAILGDPEDAQDALQNTMLKALGALPGERREIELKPWLYRIAHNESIELIRRRRQTVSLDEHRLPPGMTLAEEVETRRQLRQLLVDVGDLPERQRGALLMREAGGLKFEEIATALGTSPAVARQTVYEARLGLREMDAGRNMECTAVTKALSDGDRRVRRRRDITAHLKACSDCLLFAEEIDSRRHALASISPLPVPVAAALLKALSGGGAGAGSGVGSGAGGGVAGGAGAGSAGGVGGAGAAGGAGVGSTGGGIGGAIGAGAGKAIGTTALIKGAATIAAAAAIGVGGADVAGVLHPFHHGGGAEPQAGSAGRQGGPNDARSAAFAPPVSSKPGPSTTPAARVASDRVSTDRPSPTRLAGDRHGPPGTTAPPISTSSAVGAGPASNPTPTPGNVAGGPAPGTGIGTAPAAPAPKSGAQRPPAAPPSKSGAGRAVAAGPSGQPPAASARGQETAAAAAEKAKPVSSSGDSEEEVDAPASTAPGHPEHPEHPEHPPHPEHPVTPSHPESTEAPQPGAAAASETEAPAAGEAEAATAEAPEASAPGKSGTAPGHEKREGP